MKFGVNDWSIQQKIVMSMLLFAVVLLGVVFALYAWQQSHQTVNAYTETARGILLTVEGSRDEMEKKWAQGFFTPEQMRGFVERGEMGKVLSMIPVVTAWRTAQLKAEEGGFRFRVPKFDPRNPVNEPQPLEAKALKVLKDRGLAEYVIHDEAENALRYFRAVRLTKPCLLCHGDPAASAKIWGNDKGEDPTGAKMENWKAGEVHGAFEIIYSLEKADAKLRGYMATGGAVALAALLGGFFFAFSLARSLSRPVVATAEVVQRVAGGDFTAAIEKGYLKRGDEIGRMMRDVEGMNQGLSETVEQVKLAAVTVAGNAMQISQGNSDLSDRTQQQAAAIEQTASAMEQITSSVRNNAANSLEANDLAKKTASMAQAGGKVIERTEQAMSAVTTSSKKISDIIGVVNEIAFQTNLLALNAAVEAARAGEAGRGFAVVAGEVRNLAGRSAAAAKEIQGLITDSVNKVEQGNESVAESGRLLSEIIVNVQAVADTISEISAASQEQAQGVEEVNKAVAQMDQAVQQNAALVEQAASASESMARAAQDLRDQMSRFKVRQSGRPVVGDSGGGPAGPGPGAADGRKDPDFSGNRGEKQKKQEDDFFDLGEGGGFKEF